jgi:hypothetical protein
MAYVNNAQQYALLVWRTEVSTVKYAVESL